MPNVKELHINGAKRPVDADPDRSLLSVLRDDCQLTGAKYGCGEGKCGACTVLLNGKAVRSCKTRVEAVREKNVRTIESLAQGEKLHPVQEAFLEVGAMQCGYCTPGMIMSAVALLEENQEPGNDDIMKAMNGNICRCGTYHRIIAAIQSAGRAMKGGAR